MFPCHGLAHHEAAAVTLHPDGARESGPVSDGVYRTFSSRHSVLIWSGGTVLINSVQPDSCFVPLSFWPGGSNDLWELLGLNMDTLDSEGLL